MTRAHLKMAAWTLRISFRHWLKPLPSNSARPEKSSNCQGDLSKFDYLGDKYVTPQVREAMLIWGRNALYWAPVYYGSSMDRFLSTVQSFPHPQLLLESTRHPPMPPQPSKPLPQALSCSLILSMM